MLARALTDRFYVQPVGPGYLGQSHICLTDKTGGYQTTELEISFNNLPLTLKDVFLITTQLGTPFIWIDALCIIQNSLHDCEIESAKMPYIYSISRFCIAPDVTATAGGGCFNSVVDLGQTTSLWELGPA
ncbi:hypothetical protein QBC36DRAFT_378416 [Triangularia setosa]|uniref:Heterokaryon incompatibility domain-containing protein n=1 Tax=Triangularia setosa TaxID=2587417 RepID=A0AAN6W8S9_9PEZI|nr:hypothetical protein QBC36DRAFT_378416 [Podospora setosa]